MTILYGRIRYVMCVRIGKGLKRGPRASRIKDNLKTTAEFRFSTPNYRQRDQQIRKIE